MSNTLILPYKLGSESAKALAQELGFKRMRLEGSSVRDNINRTIINWGNSTTNLTHLPSTTVINRSASVRKASHKGEFFQAISEYNVANPENPVSIPDWTTKKSVAAMWYRHGHDVVCRAALQGHSGEGLSVVNYDDDVIASTAIPASLLYTKYVKKRDEYRVHVMGDVAFFLQRKAIPYGHRGEVDYQVRNHANGFVFTVENLDPEEPVLTEAIKAVNVLGLDFGAVDVIWNERRKEATVIEVNTACSVSGESTLRRYSKALKDYLSGETVTKWNETITSDPFMPSSIAEETSELTLNNANVAINNASLSTTTGTTYRHQWTIVGDTRRYVSFDVQAVHEAGTMLSLSAEAMAELSLYHYSFYDTSHGVEALNLLFNTYTEEERTHRMFSIEQVNTDDNLVAISTWDNGTELPIPFWIHASALSRLRQV